MGVDEAISKLYGQLLEDDMHSKYINRFGPSFRKSTPETYIQYGGPMTIQGSIAVLHA